MEVSPVIEDDGLASFQLDLYLELLHIQDSGPLSRSLVPLLQNTEILPSLCIPVVVVPSDQQWCSSRVTYPFIHAERTDFRPSRLAAKKTGEP